MKNICYLFYFLIIFYSCKDTKDSSDYTVLKGGTVFIGNGNSISDGIIIIKNGKIENIGNNKTSIPDNANIIDVTGKFITPGLIDSHVHFFQTGFFDSRPDALDLRDSINYEKTQDYVKNNPERYYEAYLRSGVTGVYDVGGFSWSIELQNSAENNLYAPHIAASGILLTPASKERVKSFNTANDSVLVHLESAEHGKSVVRLNDSLGSTGIKIHQLYLNDTTFMKNMVAVKEEIAKRGNKMIVHATTLEQAKEALKLYAKVLVHSVEDKEIDEEFIKLAKAKSIIYCPTLIVSRGYYNAYRAINYDFNIHDPNNVVDAKTKNLLMTANRFSEIVPDVLKSDEFIENFYKRITEAEKIMSINLKKVYEAQIPIAVATDAGNPGTLHGISIYKEMEAMQEAGIPAKDIITMATQNGAIAMERDDDIGTLEKGKLADLVILNKNPSVDISNMRSITHVMRGGFLHPVEKPFEENMFE
ncbi:amidohydrolase family protein [Galbibacter mesophilus]|uniref:amidohydrolase family protein n=1 Tax=Galbibacter mesophilus TaxID=379069 RepID=UPI00191EAF9B|nr:amidohydrolase family protein [Galbibacter mesophilus]MCM5663576.1 amidohydrolase family protein [Galbibacter mesophilus]